MASFFDPANPDHTDLLPEGVRKSGELASVAAEVEADVLRVYDDGASLTGYDADPALADAALASALRRAIVEVIRWRVRVLRKDPLMQSENSKDGMGRSYRTDANDPFPPNWDRWLRSYDTRVGVFIV